MLYLITTLRHPRNSATNIVDVLLMNEIAMHHNRSHHSLLLQRSTTDRRVVNTIVYLEVIPSTYSAP